jgi:hypothetical protein
MYGQKRYTKAIKKERYFRHKYVKEKSQLLVEIRKLNEIIIKNGIADNVEEIKHLIKQDEEN